MPTLTSDSQDTSASQGQQPERRKSGLRLHIVAFVILGVIVIYLFDTATDEETLNISRLIEISGQEYDYYMVGVDSIHYTPGGRADYRFRADRVTHFPDPEYSLVESPRIIMFHADESAWRINAGTGRVEMDTARNQERLTLTENVIINGITAQGRPVNITTESVTVWPQDRQLRSDSEVRLESEGLVTTSQGLFADMNTNIIRQLANGQMQYEQEAQ